MNPITFSGKLIVMGGGTKQYDAALISAQREAIKTGLKPEVKVEIHPNYRECAKPAERPWGQTGRDVAIIYYDKIKTPPDKMQYADGSPYEVLPPDPEVAKKIVHDFWNPINPKTNQRELRQPDPLWQSHYFEQAPGEDRTVFVQRILAQMPGCFRTTHYETLMSQAAPVEEKVQAGPLQLTAKPQFTVVNGDPKMRLRSLPMLLDETQKAHLLSQWSNTKGEPYQVITYLWNDKDKSHRRRVEFFAPDGQRIGKPDTTRITYRKQFLATDGVLLVGVGQDGYLAAPGIDPKEMLWQGALVEKAAAEHETPPRPDPLPKPPSKTNPRKCPYGYRQDRFVAPKYDMV